MAKIVFKKFGEPKAGAVTWKRVRDAGSGDLTTVWTVDARSKTLGQDLGYVFGRSVAKARRDNKAVAGVVDRVPAKG